MLRVEPADPLVGRPQLRRLVDIDLARLLSVRFAELLANLVALNAPNEDAPLAGEIGRTIQAKGCSKAELLRVKKGPVGVFAQVERVALPVDLETARNVGKRHDAGRVVGKSVEILVLPVWRHGSHSGFGRGANTCCLPSVRRSCPNWSGVLGRCLVDSRLLDAARAASSCHMGFRSRSRRLSSRQDSWKLVDHGPGFGVVLLVASHILTLLDQPGLGIPLKLLHECRLKEEHELIILLLRGRCYIALSSRSNVVVDGVLEWLG